MRNIIVVIISGALFLSGCGISSEQSGKSEIGINKISTFESYLYKNIQYGFQFTLPKEGELTSDEVFRGEESYDPIYAVSFYLGGDFNTIIYIYSKEGVADMIGDTRADLNFKKFESSQEIEIWQSGAIEGRGGSLFVRTVFIGSKYVYTMESSSNEKAEYILKKHQEVAESFKFEKES